MGFQGLVIHIKVTCMEAFCFALFPVLLSRDTITSIVSNNRGPIIPVADMSRHSLPPALQIRQTPFKDGEIIHSAWESGNFVSARLSYIWEADTFYPYPEVGSRGFWFADFVICRFPRTCSGLS